MWQKKRQSGVLNQSYDDQENQEPQLDTPRTQDQQQFQRTTLTISTTQDQHPHFDTRKKKDCLLQ
jgi:hypothetical protein